MRRFIAIGAASAVVSAGDPLNRWPEEPEEDPGCRIDASAFADFSAFAADHRDDAVVLGGLLTGLWDGTTLKNRSAFFERYGAQELAVSDLNLAVFGKGGLARWRLDDVAASLGAEANASGAPLSSVWFVETHHPLSAALREELQSAGGVPRLLAPVTHTGPVFSIGARGAAGHFNRHEENWFAQLWGRKRWHLLPPAAEIPAATAAVHPCEYPSDLGSVCVTHPGDVLFLGSNWWHATCNLEEAAGIVYIGARDGLPPARTAALDGDAKAVEIALSESKGLTAIHQAEQFLEKTRKAGEAAKAAEEEAREAAKVAEEEVRKAANVAKEEARIALDKAAATVRQAALDFEEAEKAAKAAEEEARKAAKAAEEVGRFALDKAAATVRQAALDFVEAEEQLRKLRLETEEAVGKLQPELARDAAHAGHTAVLQLLHRHGADLVGEGSSEPPLHKAARAGHAAVVSLLLDLRVPVSLIAGGTDGMLTALHSAAAGCSPQVAQVLLATGADAKALDANGATPAHLSARLGCLDVLVKLEAAEGTSRIDTQGRLPLHSAAVNGHSIAVEHLLAGADKHCPADNAGCEPLHHAALGGHAAAADALLKRCEDGINALGRGCGSNGARPLALAALTGSADTLAVLAAARADVEAADKGGRNALHHAAAAGHTDVSAALLALAKKGALLGVRDADGHTPAELALKEGMTAVAVLLQGHPQEEACEAELPRAEP